MALGSLVMPINAVSASWAIRHVTPHHEVDIDLWTGTRSSCERSDVTLTVRLDDSTGAVRIVDVRLARRGAP